MTCSSNEGKKVRDNCGDLIELVHVRKLDVYIWNFLNDGFLDSPKPIEEKNFESEEVNRWSDFVH